MLRNFTAALIATALIAGPALAAQPSNDAGAVPAACRGSCRACQHQSANRGQADRSAQAGQDGQARADPSAPRLDLWAPSRRTHVAKHLAKPGKVSKSIKTMKSSA